MCDLCKREAAAIKSRTMPRPKKRLIASNPPGARTSSTMKKIMDRPSFASWSEKKMDATIKNRKGPPCPIHDVPLIFTPEEGAWLCSTEGCRMKAWPPTETGLDAPPVVGTGAITLLIDGERVWVKAENNVMVEVTSVLKSKLLSDSITAHLDIEVSLFDCVFIDDDA